MAITKFRFTELPTSNVILKVAGSLVSVNNEYFISQQSQLTAEYSERGKKVATAKYQLGNDQGTWSNEASINFSADPNTDPIVFEITPDPLLVELGQEETLILNSNDRATKVEVTSIDPFITVKQNSSFIKPGTIFPLYEWNVKVKATEVNGGSITFTPKNESESFTPVIVTLIVKGNLFGVIETSTQIESS